jgi:two-component system CheB/CheR fusion protein
VQEKVLACILSFLAKQKQMDFRVYKRSTLLKHIDYRMLATAIPTMSDYLDYLQAVPGEVEALVKTLLVTYTAFFRDPDVFLYLKNKLLPELLAQSRERNRVLRCWSAGCSTGEEAYSLAMLVADLLGTELSRWSITICATDLSEEAIAFARRATYAEVALKGLPQGYRARFFERVAHGYRVVRRLRQMVVFGPQDLAAPPPFSAIDLALCRDVLSAFTPDFQERALNQFACSLFPGGFLLLGKAEALSPAHPLFESVSQGWNSYRCIGKAAPGHGTASGVSSPQAEQRIAEPGQLDVTS